MNLRLFLTLGRVSNLPTLVTNVLLGVAIGGLSSPFLTATIIVAMMLFYMGGMFMNDVFDAEFDKKLKNERPIAQGEITIKQVLYWGIGLLLTAIILLASSAAFGPKKNLIEGLLIGLTLTSFILIYDLWHKSNPLSPLVMGLCRATVIIGSSLITGASLAVPQMWIAASLLCLFIIGLTFAAKLEHRSSLTTRWPLAFILLPVFYGFNYFFINSSSTSLTILLVCVFLIITEYRAIHHLLDPIKRNVGLSISILIASICLVDAIIILSLGKIELGITCALLYFLTRYAQRFVTGT